MFTDLPLPVLISAWLLHRLAQPRIHAVDLVVYRKMLWTIEDKLPVPETWIQLQIYRPLMQWIHRELNRVELLMSIGLIFSGVLPAYKELT